MAFLKVVDKIESKVKLSKMCQTVERMNIDYIPEIEIAPELSPQQVVISPIVDNNCEVIGYQIRYGTIERGCRKNPRAAEIFDKFNRCYPKGSKTTKPRKKSKSNKKHDCLEYQLFGIECGR